MPIHVCPMDNFSSPIQVDDASMSASKKNEITKYQWCLIAKKRLLEVYKYLTRWVYEARIPFYTIDDILKNG